MQSNPLLTRLIGLSPMLAISSSLILSISMGFIFSLVLITSTLLASLTRNLVPPPAALSCYVLFSATTVTIIDFLMQAWFPDLRLALGIYLPIVAINCLIIDRTLVFAANNATLASLKDACFHSLSAFSVLILLGATRELISSGSLLKDIQLVTDHTEHLSLPLIQSSKGFSLAALPAGGFIMLGLIIAAISIIRTKSKPETRT